MSTQNGSVKSNGAPSILQKIYAQRRQDVEQAKSTPGTTLADLDTLLSLNLAPSLISVVDRLKSGPKPGLMAEIKRASPSKGDIALTANAASQALTYALGGASVISVLTEPKWFKGSILDMSLARRAIDALPNRPAILRKEFIFDEYQIAEARLHGADTVLLIVAMLPTPQLKALYSYSVSLGMEPLVEVNNATEMQTALDLGAKIIGVNNRNLHDFNVDMGTTSRLADMTAGRDVILCALSGISSSEDVRQYIDQGVGAVLVGESLMRATDTTAFIRELLCLPPKTEAETLRPAAPLGKVDGVSTPEEALQLAKEGAGLVGVYLSPEHKQAVSLKQASQISLALRQLRPNKAVEFDSVSKETPNESWFHAHARRTASVLNVTSVPLLVGIFSSDSSLDSIVHAAHCAQLDAAQLPASAPLHWASHIPCLVIRSVPASANLRELQQVQKPGLHHFVQVEFDGEPGAVNAQALVGQWGVPVILGTKGVIGESQIAALTEGTRPWAVCMSIEGYKSAKA